MTARKFSDNDVFITLIRTAEVYPYLAGRVLAITRLPDAERKMKVRQLVAYCQAKGAPEDFIAALAYLGDNGIASKVNARLASSRQ